MTLLASLGLAPEGKPGAWRLRRLAGRAAVLVACLWMLAPSAARPQTRLPSGPLPFEAGYPKRIPAPGGEVIIPGEQEERAYEDIKFAPARRHGGALYVSGVIAAVPPGRTADVEGAKRAFRFAFRIIERTLRAADATFDDVVMINSFHVWEGPQFAGTRDEHFAAFSAVKDEFMKAPHPAWTAVGTSGLLADTGLVEIQMIAHVSSDNHRAGESSKRGCRSGVPCSGERRQRRSGPTVGTPFSGGDR